jgi:hypothetical protein
MVIQFLVSTKTGNDWYQLGVMAKSIEPKVLESNNIFWYIESNNMILNIISHFNFTRAYYLYKYFGELIKIAYDKFISCF